MDSYDRASTLAPAPNTDERRPRILVIEDDRHVLTLLRDLLETWGYAADVVPNGRAGLARFDAGAYDVVLTDLAMAEVSGLDVAAEVRDRDAAVAVIMFTASMRDLDGEGQRLGFSVLRKPLDIDGLRRSLDASLARSPR